MPSNTQDLAGTVSIQNFAMVPSRVSATLTNPLASIQYKAFGPINGEYDAIFEYSVDGGSSYHAATPDNPLDLLNIATSPDGEEGMFDWDIEGDIGTERFNKDIMVRLRMSDGTHTSIWSYISLYTTRITTDSTNKVPGIPDKNHTGVSTPSKGLKKDII